MNWFMMALFLLPGLASVAADRRPEMTFKDIRIEAPFRKYLLDRPLLMELGGAETIDVESGGKLVIGVGKVVLKDGSPEGIDTARRVATLKAQVALVAELEGVQVSYSKRIEERVIRKSTNNKDGATEVTDRHTRLQERLSGSVQNAKVVGSWLSKDGKVLYVALAQPLSPANRNR